MIPLSKVQLPVEEDRRKTHHNTGSEPPDFSFRTAKGHSTEDNKSSYSSRLESLITKSSSSTGTPVSHVVMKNLWIQMGLGKSDEHLSYE
ncbi:hypothetical protein Taro_030978 [Colocasia esculenta]|uniref:Uncharacterized protein n=1 Tax=Colocasia esculenta TaxID=4460 RepID=A0A843VMS2_COLES|nr:hypothetical protein [Colocasia esculenta]